MGKILVYIYDGMAYFEISLLTHLLGADCGKELLVISDNTDLVRDKSGVLYKPENRLNSIVGEEIEGLIIPGGWLKNLDEELIKLIKKLNEGNKFLAAICASSWILAKAGVLYNRKYTTTIEKWEEKHKKFFGIEDPFPREGYLDNRVIRDGNIITAKGTAFIDFAIEVCDYLELFKDELEKINFGKELKGD